ncbi:MAG: molybdopterin-dependent oxidoreductase [Armatimonadota bacterium]|nr:molybdopterin-dependent oxidoreductase [Armatimonadota bacterium]
MRQWFSWRGAAAGAMAGSALVWVLAANVVPAGLVLAGAIAERARALLPLQALGYIIVTLKFAAKPFGFWTSMGAVVLLTAAFGGLWAPRSRTAFGGGAAIATATGLGLAAVAASPALHYLSARLGAEGAERPDAQALRLVLVSIAVAAPLIGGVFAVTLCLLARRRGASPEGTVSPPPTGGISRRQFLAHSAVAGAALTGAGMLVHWLGTAAAQAAAAAQSIFQRVRGLPLEVTPNDKFYVVSKNPAGLDPRLDARKWGLEITGLVGKPVKLTYDDIKAMPSFSRYHTLECISNEVGGDLIGNAMWKGVRFRDLIDRAGGLNPTAIRFALRCADGYSEGLPVADAMRPEVMLAYEMNGVPLPPSHGFPVRLLVPGLFGMKNPKWLTKIEAVSTHFTGYWQASGWSDEAVVQTMSQFRVPAGRDVSAGEIGLGGVAYSGDRGIKDVEVSTDDGKTWVRVEVKPPLGPYTWVLWAAIWKPTGPGEYVLKVRARDGAGIVQTAREAPTLPDGATGYHTIRVRVRR